MTSDRVEQLDAPAEVFYRRLMSKVDDHGLYDARPSVLRTSLYPLRVDRVREADCSRWIAACEKAGLIALYAHEGKPFLQMLDTRWTARSEPKYPLPTTENRCEQPQTVVPVFGVVVLDEDDKTPRKRVAPPDGVSDEVWQDFQKLRRAKRAPITDTVIAGLVREGAKAGLPLQAVVQMCCERGWQAFKAEWLETKATPTSTVPTNPAAIFTPPPKLTEAELAANRVNAAKTLSDLKRAGLKAIQPGAH